jgi:hypothetical protein
MSRRLKDFRSLSLSLVFLLFIFVSSFSVQNDLSAADTPGLSRVVLRVDGMT